MQVCYYRDKQTTNKFQIAKVTAEGASISEPFALETKWDYKASVKFAHLLPGQSAYAT
jgi:20S proteasome subunit beta 7